MIIIIQPCVVQGYSPSHTAIIFYKLNSVLLWKIFTAGLHKYWCSLWMKGKEGYKTITQVSSHSFQPIVYVNFSVPLASSQIITQRLIHYSLGLLLTRSFNLNNPYFLSTLSRVSVPSSAPHIHLLFPLFLAGSSNLFLPSILPSNLFLPSYWLASSLLMRTTHLHSVQKGLFHGTVVCNSALTVEDLLEVL